MSEKDYFDIVINVREMFGFKKSSKSVRKYVAFYVFLPLLIAMYFLVLINFRFKNKDIFEITEVFESAATFGPLIMRKLTILLHSKRYDEIIEQRSKFWNYDVCGENFGEKLRQKTENSLILMKIFWTMGFFSVIVIAGTPLLVEDSILPNSCWVPNDDTYLYFVIYFSQSVFLVELVLSSGVTDAFFLFVCTDLEIQLKLMSRTLQNFKIEGNNAVNLRKLKECSSHHRLLLKVHKQLGKIFSMFFISQFLLSIFGVTMQFFVLSEPSTDILHVFRSLAYIVTIIFQGALGFLPASNVEIQAENLAKEIYNFEWYNTSSLEISKFVLFWLMKAQVPLVMSGGGLMKINRNVFLQIPRTSFSIATLLK